MMIMAKQITAKQDESLKSATMVWCAGREAPPLPTKPEKLPLLYPIIEGTSIEAFIERKGSTAEILEMVP